MDASIMKSLVIHTIEEQFNIPKDKVLKYTDMPLTLQPFCFDAISMAYLYISLKEKLSFCIPSQVLEKYTFITIDSIVELCCKYSSPD